MGKPDASDFLGVVDDYHIGLYGSVEVVRAQLLPGLRANDPAVRAALSTWGGEVHLHDADGVTDVVLIRPTGPVVNRWPLHVALFLLTLLTTLAAGALLRGIDPMRTWFMPIGDSLLPVPTGIDPPALWTGAMFALPFLGILLAHESGHYVAARRHGIPVTPPFFIPFPPWYSLVGTLGAFIKIKGPTVRRSVLFDVAAAGPFASFVLSLPALLVGLGMSEPAISGSASVMAPFVVRFAGETVRLGNGPLLHVLATAFFPGTFGHVPIALHPLAFAGWLGMFVTALNLLPLGQLDGGHILYSLWEQPGQVRAARVFVAALVPLGLIWWGWWLWGGAALLVNRGRLRHPPVVLPAAPLTPMQARLAWVAILIFFLTFVPVPLSM